MYIVREFAACLIVAMLVGVVVLVICGIGYLLKLGFTMTVWMVRKIVIAYGASILEPQAVRFTSSSVACITATPAVVADFPS
jgi:hypothetical protein